MCVFEILRNIFRVFINFYFVVVDAVSVCASRFCSVLCVPWHLRVCAGSRNKIDEIPFIWWQRRWVCVCVDVSRASTSSKLRYFWAQPVVPKRNVRTRSIDLTFKETKNGPKSIRFKRRLFFLITCTKCERQEHSNATHTRAKRSNDSCVWAFNCDPFYNKLVFWWSIRLSAAVRCEQRERENGRRCRRASRHWSGFELNSFSGIWVTEKIISFPRFFVTQSLSRMIKFSPTRDPGVRSCDSTRASGRFNLIKQFDWINCP